MSSEQPGFSPEQAFDFLQKMWNPLGLAFPGMPVAGGAPAPAFPNPAAMFASLDPLEVERKIQDLRAVEQWLQMNLNLLQMTIKTMEWQKSALEGLRAQSASNADTEK